MDNQTAPKSSDAISPGVHSPGQIINRVKLLNKSYKYVMAAVSISMVIAIFNALGTGQVTATDKSDKNTEASSSSTSSDTKNNNTQEPKFVSNTTDEHDLQQLEEIIAQEGTTPSSQEDNQNENTGRVLQANTVVTNVDNNKSVAYNQFFNFFGTMLNVTSDAIEGGITQTEVKSASGENYTVTRASGALPGMINMMGTMYEQKPVSVEVWAQDIRQRIDPTAYAADSNDSSTYNPGQGYELLTPIQSLWRAGVNLVYVIYILIVVLLAFLILFRSQLGGQETITLYNSIPSLIISLVLVYFSYPISALAIDLVTVGSGVVYGALVGDGSATSDAPGKFLYTTNFGDPNNGDIVDDAVEIITGDNSNINARTDLQIDDKQVNIWQVFSTSGISPTGQDIEVIIPRDVPLVNALGNIIGSIAGADITDSLLKLVFVFAAFSSSLKLFFSLLKCYVFLIVLPLASPFIFLLAAIPSQTTSIISQYFGRLLASALSFVAVYAVFLVIIIIARDNTSPGDVIWTPPLLGYSPDQALPGSGITNIARPLIGYALFVSTPLIPDYIFELFQAKGDNPFVQNAVDATKAGGRNVLGMGTFAYTRARGFLGIPQAKQ